MRYVVIILCAFFSSESLVAQTESTAKIQFNVSDAHGKPLPCRIHLKNSQGQPQKAVDQPFWRDHFVCSGLVSVDVAPGTYTWQIERGPEYERATRTLEVDTDKEIYVSLKRIVDLRNSGWYSGDLHVHRSIDEIELLTQAEDLDFAPVITWWNTKNLWQGKSMPKETETTFDGRRIHTVMAGEDEREGGALLYFNLNQPLALPDRRRSAEFPSPMKFVQQAHQASDDVWIDIEKPFWWDVPTWLASGKMDSIGIANNHMCRSQMLVNEAWGKPRDVARLPNPRGNGFWTQEIYYHALNAGLRIPPSAGSASGVLPNPVGYNRVYVYLDQPFSRQNWFDGLSKGRCFVTNGPLLRVKANSRHAGTILRTDEQGHLQVELTIDLVSNDPITALEVIHNGRIAKTIACNNKKTQQHTATITLDEPGWFLVRSIADVDQTFRFASTAPWYVESETTKQRISKPSAQFFLDWVDERIARVQKNLTDPDQVREVLQPHQVARAFWLDRLGNANADLKSESFIQKTSHSVAALPIVDRVESQPLLASIRRLQKAMEYIGSARKVYQNILSATEH